MLCESKRRVCIASPSGHSRAARDAGTWALGLLLTLAMACGGSSSSAPSAPTPPVAQPPPPPSPSPPPPPMTAQVTITAAGVSPKEVTVARGGRVTFVNDDVRPHDVFSDPDHIGTDCPAVNVVGFLTAGRRGETGPLDVARRCGYHDHLATTDDSLRGAIIVVDP